MDHIFFDGTMLDPKLRRLIREERTRIFRKARKARIAAKRSFFGEA